MRPPKNTSMACQDLPNYPSKGKRRILDQRWLDRLHREGLEGMPADQLRPPADLGLAVAQFNRGDFWTCHETLERVWLPESYPLRLFYHGLIKAAVGMYHLSRHNRSGAVSKLSDGISTLAPFVPEMMGVDVAGLRADLSERLALVQNPDRVNWASIDGLTPIQIRVR